MEKVKTLIVEDETIIVFEMKNQLQSLGYELTAIVDMGIDTVVMTPLNKA